LSCVLALYRAVFLARVSLTTGAYRSRLWQVTYAIMFVIDKIPGLHFRATEQAEIIGMDDSEHAEFAADYVGFRREADTVFTKSEKLWGSSGPPDNVSQRSVRSLHDGERGRGVRVHDAIDEEKANGVDFAGVPSEAPEKTGYRQPGGNENITRLRSRSRSRGLRSVGEHREVSRPAAFCPKLARPPTDAGPPTLLQSGDEVELDNFSSDRQ